MFRSSLFVFKLYVHVNIFSDTSGHFAWAEPELSNVLLEETICATLAIKDFGVVYPYNS